MPFALDEVAVLGDSELDEESFRQMEAAMGEDCRWDPHDGDELDLVLLDEDEDDGDDDDEDEASADSDFDG